jgi:two-component system, sensor histidine kinase and response regulator
MIAPSDPSKVNARGLEIFRSHLEAGYRNIDRMFAMLFFAEWMASILLALTYSPLAWAGEFSRPHIHVWVALILGGGIVGLPMTLALARPGRLSTRSCVSMGQMLLVGLLIHLSGGRPEFHFHVFVSLAFLALYRDWRMLVIGGAVVAIDHFLRGIYWPRSVFGLQANDSWRWVEHSLWIVFEAGVLSFAITRALGSILECATREAEVESTRDRVELLVAARTVELEQANARLLIEIRVRRDAENEALLARELAEEATRAKSQFLANMSHEIRTPMNAIIGMTELTLDLKMPDDQREYLEIVRKAADSLLVLIDEILDFSKVEANRLELESIRFSVPETLLEATKTLSVAAAEKGLTISCSVARGIPKALLGDPHRLRQVLLNLLGNAIKFTDKGKVHLSATVEHAEADGLVLHFSISDEGIGIPGSRLAMIFDPFIQADGSTTRRFGGTGLGLSICSKLVDLMGGRIWVESEVGRGSTFHFTARFENAPWDDSDPAEPLKIKRLVNKFDR